MKVVFFGTPHFAAHVLNALLQNGVEIVAVVTKPDRPQGRSQKPLFTPVKELAIEKNLPVFQPEKASDPSFADSLRSYNAHLVVVVAYGEIIKENLLGMPKLGSINLHASLLPKYRGAAPIQFSLLNGDQETGVTIIEMAPKMDAGDILAKESIPIPLEMTFNELEKKLCELGIKKLLEVIRQFENGTITKTPQDHSKATYVKKIDPTMAEIDWKESAETLHNRIRAFSPKPGAWCNVKIGGQIKRLKILRSRPLNSSESSDRFRWIVPCGKGFLEILEVQPEGKKRMQAADFLRGHGKPSIPT